MRGKLIARALERLGSDPEMMRHLIDLEDALTAVLGAEEVACDHCGRKTLDLGPDEIPLLAERLLDAVCAVQDRIAQQEGSRPGEERSTVPPRRAWSRCSPDLPSSKRNSKSRDGLKGGDR
jgi:hypothetical protein